MRQELTFFFLTPYERWKEAGEIPYTMFVQILKLVIVTTQVGIEGIRFLLRTTPSHVSIPPNQNGTMAKSR